MLVNRAQCAAFIVLATLYAIEGLRCYVCDSRSVIGYYDAEKDCNTDRSLQECPDVKHKACMIEAFRHDAGSVYHIVKRCLAECPAFVNGSAEHTRCCAKEACNDVISIDVIDHRTASDLVADARETQSAQQPQPQPAPYSPPPHLTDNSNINEVQVERADDDDDFRRRRPAVPSVDLWTPPLPPPPPLPSASSTSPSTAEHGGGRPPTSPSTPRRERRPLSGGGNGGAQWWKGGLRSSSTPQRSTASITVVTAALAAVCTALH